MRISCCPSGRHHVENCDVIVPEDVSAEIFLIPPVFKLAVRKFLLVRSCLGWRDPFATNSPVNKLSRP